MDGGLGARQPWLGAPHGAGDMMASVPPTEERPLGGAGMVDEAQDDGAAWRSARDAHWKAPPQLGASVAPSADMMAPMAEAAGVAPWRPECVRARGLSVGFPSSRSQPSLVSSGPLGAPVLARSRSMPHFPPPSPPACASDWPGEQRFDIAVRKRQAGKMGPPPLRRPPASFEDEEEEEEEEEEGEGDGQDGGEEDGAAAAHEADGARVFTFSGGEYERKTAGPPPRLNVDAAASQGPFAFAAHGTPFAHAAEGPSPSESSCGSTTSPSTVCSAPAQQLFTFEALPAGPPRPRSPAPGWHEMGAGNMFKYVVDGRIAQVHICDMTCRYSVWNADKCLFVCSISGLQSRRMFDATRKNKRSADAPLEGQKRVRGPLLN